MSIFKQYTWRSLKKNKVRTFITILGIVLSVAMLTAVTTTMSSLQDFMLKVVIEEKGSWHAFFSNIKDDKQLVTDEKVEKSGTLRNIGYAKLENNLNETRPYLYVGAYDGELADLCSVHVVEGRMPQNSHEIIVPKYLQEYENGSYQVGDTLALDLGVREYEGRQLWQYESSCEGETWRSLKSSMTFQIVGVFERGLLGEMYSAPGYTILTKADANVKAESMDCYVTWKNMRDVKELYESMKEQLLQENSGMISDVNSRFLTYSGHSMNSTTQKIMYGMVSILMGIIMLGSIALIYNSFSISVSERKREYGLLSSIGATKKQLRRSMLFESVILSCIGVPVGVLAGIGGMAVTFRALGPIFQRFLYAGSASQPITLQMSASLFAIILAAVVGFITVLLSAWLPARKALKSSAIEAIRQTDDIRVKPRRLKTSWLTQKMFGLEGTLASKNFKRNKRKYRATVFSLVISIALFVSASSFCDYLSASVTNMTQDCNYDLQYTSSDLSQEKKLYSDLAGVNGVTDSTCYLADWNASVAIAEKELSEDYFKVALDSQRKEEGKDTEIAVKSIVYFIDDASYEKYLEKNGIDKTIFMDTKNPKAVALDKWTSYDSETGKYKVIRVIDSKQLSGRLMLQDEKKRKDDYETIDESKSDNNGKLLVGIGKYDSEGVLDDASVQYVRPEEIYNVSDIQIGAVTEELPMGVIQMSGYLTLLYPRSAMSTICRSDDEFDLTMAFRSSDPDKSYGEMSEIVKENKNGGNLYNMYNELQSSKGLLTVINVFSYGFIILISLIAVANVFNTISTNIALRRREFAMLRSVGMTQKGFYKMMNFECLLYGCKGVLYGLVIAVGFTYLIYWSISSGLDMAFYIPWYSVVIAVGSVFLVVFATMLYAMRKIKKDNVVETLKNENY